MQTPVDTERHNGRGKKETKKREIKKAHTHAHSLKEGPIENSDYIALVVARRRERDREKLTRMLNICTNTHRTATTVLQKHTRIILYLPVMMGGYIGRRDFISFVELMRTEGKTDCDFIINK